MSPLDVDDVIMVLRAFPIRVPGNSGPLPNKTDWDTVTEESGSPDQLIERTSVTGGVRRVARFHPRVVRLAIEANAPTQIVLNHVDYVDFACRRPNGFTEKANEFVRRVEADIGQSIDYLGYGPSSLNSRSSPKHLAISV